MEQQSSAPAPNTSLFQLNIEAGSAYSLKGAASWAKVLAICGFIFGILFIILALNVDEFLKSYSTNNRYGEDGRVSSRTSTTIAMIMYIIMGLIFIISSVFALNFSNKINRALRTNDQHTLNAGFSSARNYFAFWAVLMILMLLLMLIGMAGMMVGRS